MPKSIVIKLQAPGLNNFFTKHLRTTTCDLLFCRVKIFEASGFSLSAFIMKLHDRVSASAKIICI